jgi:hypothetical protein
MLYAVVPAGLLSPPAGATGSALQAVSGGSVDILFEEREELPTGSRDEVLAFGRRLQQLADTCTLLPVRFGSVLPGRAEVTELLAERQDQWRSRLEHVAGHVEVLVHAWDEDAPEPATVSAAAGSGQRYLMSRAAVLHHRERLVEELHAVASPLCREVRVLPADPEVRLACLVRAEGVADLRAALERWTGSEGTRRVRMTGPWPPFSFATEEVAP